MWFLNENFKIIFNQIETFEKSSVNLPVANVLAKGTEQLLWTIRRLKKFGFHYIVNCKLLFNITFFQVDAISSFNIPFIAQFLYLLRFIIWCVQCGLCQRPTVHPLSSLTWSVQ